MKVATISWKCKVGVERSKELGNLMTIVFSHHHSEDDSEMCPPILRDSQVSRRTRSPLRDGGQESSRAWSPTHTLDVFIIGGWTGIKDYFVTLILQRECAL